MTLYATGSPGESAAGFHLLNHPTTVADGEALILRHLAPTARLRVGQELIRQAGPLAMIDLSDGLGKDARELARQSNLALILDRASLPVSEALRRAANATGQSAEHWLLNGGEDYELLFATHAPEELLREITGTLPLHRLGRVEPGNGVWLASGGGRIPLSEKSFDHFAK
jgi:thiamine-monophosphate kinase